MAPTAPREKGLEGNWGITLFLSSLPTLVKCIQTWTVLFVRAILLQDMIASVSPRSEEGVPGLDLTTGLAEGGDNRNYAVPSYLTSSTMVVSSYRKADQGPETLRFKPSPSPLSPLFPPP